MVVLEVVNCVLEMVIVDSLLVVCVVEYYIK